MTGVVLLALILFVVVPWCFPYRHVVNLAAPGDVVAVLGDSIPAGHGEGVGESRAWPTLVAHRLGLRIKNFSVPGDTTEKGLARLRDVLAEHPRLVIVELGGNDMLGSVDVHAMKQNLVAIFSGIQETGACVTYVAVPTPMRAEYAEAWELACRENGVWYVPNIMKGVLSNRQLMGDFIHPNAAGQEVLADRMESELRDLLRAADRKRGR